MGWAKLLLVNVQSIPVTFSKVPPKSCQILLVCLSKPTNVYNAEPQPRIKDKSLLTKGGGRDKARNI